MRRRAQLIFYWIAGTFLSSSMPAAPVAPRLSQDAYVWQRQWNASVQRSVLEHGPEFRRIVLLTGEVAWNGKAPKLTEAAIDYSVLRTSQCRIGLALRIGPYSGLFSTNGQPIRALVQWAETLIALARTNGVNPCELQLDFDCPDSKLEGYAQWVLAFRNQLAPLPIVITALPSWLRYPQFKHLLDKTQGYVLQVHSLERPGRLGDPFTLCDPEKARRAVELASRLDTPFRVALPTYGYCMAFRSDGRFVGVSAEQADPAWPADTQTQEIRSDPGQICGLVQAWNSRPPSGLEGIIWYRLPVEQDRLNWSWPTLAAVREGRRPTQHVRAEAHKAEPGLVDVVLFNDGEAEHGPVKVRVHWAASGRGSVLAADSVSGVEIVHESANAIRFEMSSSAQSLRLRPGARQTLGWVRLYEDKEVDAEIIP